MYVPMNLVNLSTVHEHTVAAKQLCNIGWLCRIHARAMVSGSRAKHSYIAACTSLRHLQLSEIHRRTVQV